MKSTCHCGDDGDAVVFGPCRKCSPTPESVHARNLAAELDRLEREDPTVKAAAESLTAVGEHIRGCLPSSVIADIYDPPVLRDPYDLDDDERRGF